MKRRNFDNHSPFHKTGHTSKGDQRKWKVGDRWYKADYMGYESLAEVLVSHFLEADERKRHFYTAAAVIGTFREIIKRKRCGMLLQL